MGFALQRGLTITPHRWLNHLTKEDLYFSSNEFDLAYVKVGRQKFHVFETTEDAKAPIRLFLYLYKTFSLSLNEYVTTLPRLKSM